MEDPSADAQSVQSCEDHRRVRRVFGAGDSQPGHQDQQHAQDIDADREGAVQTGHVRQEVHQRQQHIESEPEQEKRECSAQLAGSGGPQRLGLGEDPAGDQGEGNEEEAGEVLGGLTQRQVVANICFRLISNKLIALSQFRPNFDCLHTM
jgi:hypothetical protein